jgi:hypothetical protein
VHWAAKHGYEFRHHDNDADMRVGNSRAFVFLRTDDEGTLSATGAPPPPSSPASRLLAAAAVGRGRVQPEERDATAAAAALPSGGVTDGSSDYGTIRTGLAFTLCSPNVRVRKG